MPISININNITTKSNIIYSWYNPICNIFNGSFYSEDKKRPYKNEFNVKIFVKYTYVDEWIYDFGKNRFTKILVFNNGNVVFDNSLPP